MPLAYRAIATVTDQPAIELAERELSQWLADKGAPDTLEAGTHVGRDGQRLTTVRHASQDGARSARHRFTERNHAGTWTTTLTVHEPANGQQPGWVSIELDAPASHTVEAAVPGAGGGTPSGQDVDGAGSRRPLRQYARVPNLARNILGACDAHDHGAHLADTAQLVLPDEVDTLIDLLCDPERAAPVLVAGPLPAFDQHKWVRHVSKLTRQTVGLAATYVLSEAAAVELTKQVGPLHAVPHGAIRTYLRELDPASTADARRHRILTSESVARGPDSYLVDLLAVSTRRLTTHRALPAQLARVGRVLDTAETARTLDHLQLEPAQSLTVAMPIHAGEHGPSPAPVTSTGQALTVAEASRETAPAVDDVDLDDMDAEVVARSLPGSAASAEQLAELLALDGRRALSRLMTGIGQLRTQDRTSPAEETTTGPDTHTTAAAAGRLHELTDRVTELQDHLEALTGEVDVTRRRLEDEQLEHAETLDQMRTYAAEVDRLRLALTKAGHTEAAWAVHETKTAESPTSFEQLLEWLRDAGRLSHIEFTGHEKAMLALDDYDDLGSWATVTWDALTALDAYARAHTAGDFNGGVHAYLKNPPTGYVSFPVARHAPCESETVGNQRKMRRERIFPVPATVSPDGTTFMDAHFRIGRKGMISPRLYYLDDCARTGKVYVGYIGRHLTNTQTN